MEKTALIRHMEKQQPQPHDDECPHCRVLLEIVSVKIGLTGVTMQSICPNCCMVPPEDPGSTGPKMRRKSGAMSLLRKRRDSKPR
jgi:hypothetical protein